MNKLSICIINILFLSVIVFSQEDDIIHPVVGGELYYLNKKVDWIEGWEVMRVQNENDANKVREYLAEILKDKDTKVVGKMTLFDLLTKFPDIEGKTPYVLLCAHNNLQIVYKHPYLNGNIVYFDAVQNMEAGKNTASLWIFYIPGEQELRVRLNGDGYAAEFGLYSFMPDRFKKGKKIDKECGDLTIIGCGEFFQEPYLMMKNGDIEEYSINGLQNYRDTFCVKIGSIIGLKCELTGRKNVQKEYGVKIIHPAIASGPRIGITDELTSKMFTKGEPDYILWQFSEDYELIPGEWKINLYDEDSLIFSKNIQILIWNERPDLGSDLETRN